MLHQLSTIQEQHHVATHSLGAMLSMILSFRLNSVCIPGFHTGFYAGGRKLFRKSKRPCRGVWGHSGRGSFRKIILAHVMLGGSGGMVLWKFLKFRPSEITSGAFSSKFIAVNHTPS